MQIEKCDWVERSIQHPPFRVRLQDNFMLGCRAAGDGRKTVSRNLHVGFLQGSQVRLLFSNSVLNISETVIVV